MGGKEGWGKPQLPESETTCGQKKTVTNGFRHFLENLDIKYAVQPIGTVDSFGRMSIQPCSRIGNGFGWRKRVKNNGGASVKGEERTLHPPPPPSPF